jgi:hypothetical protein
MARWRRRGSIDAQTVAALPTEAGERVLAGAQDDAGRWHVGTDRALLLTRDDAWHRLPWQRVDQATWDRDTERFVVVEVADYGRPQPRHVIGMAEPGQLLELVRERVTASIVLSRHVPVQGSDGLQVVARRAPVAGGEVEWSVRLADSLDPDDPRVLAAVERALAEGRAELGL